MLHYYSTNKCSLLLIEEDDATLLYLQIQKLSKFYRHTVKEHNSFERENRLLKKELSYFEHRVEVYECYY